MPLAATAEFVESLRAGARARLSPLYRPSEPPSLPRRVRAPVDEWQREAGQALSLAAELGFGRRCLTGKGTRAISGDYTRK